jgi:type I restriction enzyme S subunit
MSFPRYPAYKDSGHVWLDSIPEHWEVGPIKHHIRTIESGTSVNAFDEPADNGQLGVLKTSCVYSGTFDPRENKTVVSEDAHRVSCPVRVGTLIVSRMNTPDLVGAAGLVTGVRPNLYLPDRLWQISLKSADPRFAYYWTRIGSYRAQVEAACTGTSSSMKNLGQDQFGSFTFPAPPLWEQKQIVAFLDRETAQIDEMATQQRRLIELLKEKRQVVISHAVTKGLSPDVPFKPSGVEWLGDVPAHWEIGPLKRYWAVIDCKHLTADFVEDGIPIVSIREVQGRWVVLENAKCTTEHFYELLTDGGRRPLPGDLIFSRNATVGEVAQVRVDHPRFAMGQDVVLLRKLAPYYSSDYLQHVIRSPIVVQQLADLMIGSTFKRINVEEVRSLAVPSPPPPEQAKIAAFLEREAKRFDELVTQAQRAVELLQERRIALISAAVTGQIDVREVAVAEAA